MKKKKPIWSDQTGASKGITTNFYFNKTRIINNSKYDGSCEVYQRDDDRLVPCYQVLTSDILVDGHCVENPPEQGNYKKL